MNEDAFEQALVAFIAEAKKSGLDVEKTSMEAKAGIMGNKIYSWISTKEKNKAVDALDEAIAEVSKLNL
ncbi:hypothetical protein [Algibacillus agarilyticus]|uniref:hypothetical protein n=1 Tax=Algibacillus agarilyticus TaxID=2234133 RepID=UPI000DD0D256|nr:hypothetical protein [Algibacillus agarilyticus]